MSAQPGAPASQTWFSFFQDVRARYGVTPEQQLFLLARWADAQERENPSSTYALAEWLVRQLDLLDGATPDDHVVSLPEGSADAPLPQPV